MKELIKKYKELKKNPRYNALFKLTGWFIFFLILGILARVAGDFQELIPSEDKQEIKIKYNEMKTDLLNNNLKIKLNIKKNQEYYIEGTIINNMFEGTLEYEDKLYKINIEDGNLYILNKDEKVLEETLPLIININYIFPKEIFNLIKEELPIKKQTEEETTYNYKTNNKNITIYTTDEKIYKITLTEENSTYELRVDAI